MKPPMISGDPKRVSKVMDALVSKGSKTWVVEWLVMNCGLPVEKAKAAVSQDQRPSR